MGGILSILSNLFGAIGGYFGWAKQIQEEVNSPEMKANAEAKIRSKESDLVNQEIEDAHSSDKKKAQHAQDELKKAWSED